MVVVERQATARRTEFYTLEIEILVEKQLLAVGTQRDHLFGRAALMKKAEFLHPGHVVYRDVFVTTKQNH